LKIKQQRDQELKIKQQRDQELKIKHLKIILSVVCHTRAEKEKILTFSPIKKLRGRIIDSSAEFLFIKANCFNK